MEAGVGLEAGPGLATLAQARIQALLTLATAEQPSPRAP